MAPALFAFAESPQQNNDGVVAAGATVNVCFFSSFFPLPFTQGRVKVILVLRQLFILFRITSANFG